jgi:hypothetical protein
MGLRSGGDSFVAARSCGGGAVLKAPLDNSGGAVVTTLLVGGGGGGGGHTADPVFGESRSTSLAPVLGARVLVGRPRGPIWIHVVFLYANLLSGDSETSMASTGSSSSSSSTTATSTTSSTLATPSSPSLSPSLGLSEDNTNRSSATRHGHEPIPWMAQGGSRRPLREVVGSEGSIG